MWTIQEFVQLIKDDLELHDLPATVTDTDIIERIKRSSLKEFSILYPRREKFRINHNDLTHPEMIHRSRHRGLEYAIPKWFLLQFIPVTLIRVDAYRYGDYYGDLISYSIGYDAGDLINDIAEIKGAAQISQNMGHALTADYDEANKTITLYNGYYDGTYEVEMGVAHDINLRTIPKTAMLTFRQLATYDVGEYIYSKIFRKEGVETGAGSINLNIGNLQECKSKHADLIKELTDEAALDMETLEYF